MRPMTTEQLAQVLDELRHLVDQLEQGVSVPRYDPVGKVTHELSPTAYEVLRLATAATADGYPRRSMGGSGSHSVASDPTGDVAGELAEGRGLSDSIRYHRDSVQRGITGALGDLRLARDALGKLVGTMRAGPGEPGCVIHRRVLGLHETATRGNRCDWCYRFALAEGIDPPAVLLERKEQGKHITKTMVAEAVAEERKARRQSNKKRRQKAARR